jgi:hypothetical protein
MSTFNPEISDIECTILDMNSPKNEQPDRISIKLKDHQLSLIHRCRILENSTTNELTVGDNQFVTKIGIIGDIVGSGKTLSVLSLIATKPVIETHIVHTSTNNIISITNNTPKPKVEKQNVIVVPHNIFKQWSSTIEKYTNFKYIGINTAKSMTKFNEDSVKPEFDEIDIILVSSTRYNNFSPTYSIRKCYSRVFFDEADSIKIPSCNNINSSFLWFITSTYNALCNPYGARYYINEQTGQSNQFYSYINGYTKVKYIEGIKNTGFIKNTITSINNLASINSIKKFLIIRNSDEYIKQAFDLPDYISHILKSKNPLCLSILNSFASKDIMNHINAGDIKGAIELLNCHKVTEKDLIKGVTNDFEEKLNNKIIELEMKTKMTYSSDSAKLESLTKIRESISQLQTKIRGIKDKINDNNLCCICYDDIETTALTMCCNTKFCIGCISTWLHTNNKCPFCRAKITNDNICVVTDNIPENKAGSKDEMPTKLQHLAHIIDKNKNNEAFKLLVFADFNNTFTDIIEYMNSVNIKYSRVMGSGASVNKTLNNYRNVNSNDPTRVDVLMLNADYCASGINLENTSDIVIFHKMTEQKTRQIIGRGQRPGRNGVLNVWNLCYSTEL